MSTPINLAASSSPNPSPTPSPTLPSDEQLIFQENLASLQQQALTANKNSVYFFNLTVKNYDTQVRSGGTKLTLPQSIQVQTVDANVLDTLWVKLETAYSDSIDLDDAITSSLLIVPPGNMLAIDTAGNITQIADPTAIVAPPVTVGNPVGAAVVGYAGVFHAVPGDTNKEGFKYTDATGVYVKEESIVFGPVYVKIS